MRKFRENFSYTEEVKGKEKENDDDDDYYYYYFVSPIF